MIQIWNARTPDVDWWLQVLKGMRYPYKSTDKNDSFACYGEGLSAAYPDECLSCSYCDFVPGENEDTAEVICSYDMGNEGFPTIVLGKNDKNLLLSLCKSGSSHRKVLRQLPVILDINAPMYWWKQMDQYSVGTTTNSESLMHTALKKKFQLDDFSLEPMEISFNTKEDNQIVITNEDTLKYIISHLNALIDLYFEADNEIDKEEIWNNLIAMIPQSYNQRRVWTGNYEVLLNIIDQRLGHKLPEWRDFIINILREVPYLKDICLARKIFFIENNGNDLGEPQKAVMFYDRENGDLKQLCWYEDIVDKRYYY